jgi:SPX domain protein involved in polyphosphate accumulation/uncharacterized membrane protein YidH (DUF202 family)
MKFGAYLELCQEQAAPLFSQGYVEYGYLKKKLKDILTAKALASVSTDSPLLAGGNETPAAVPPPLLLPTTSSSFSSSFSSSSSLSPSALGVAALLREWALLLETEIAKVDRFTVARVEEAKTMASALSRKCGALWPPGTADPAAFPFPRALLASSSSAFFAGGGRASFSMPGGGAASTSTTSAPAASASAAAAADGPLGILERLDSEADEFATLLLELDRYAALNHLAISKISKKYDKVTGLTTREWILARLEGTPGSFRTTKLEGFLVVLSDVYSRLRQARQDVVAAADGTSAAASGAAGGGGGVWVPPESFARDTTKYIVRTEDVFRLKALVVRHLPLLVFGRDTSRFKAVTPLEKDRILLGTDAGEITSVYLDNPSFDVYHTRIARLHGATLTRIRWYGPDAVPPADARVFVERKTHTDKKVVDDPSLKERFPMRCGRVTALLSGGLDVPGYVASAVATGDLSAKSSASAQTLAAEVQADSVTRGLRASVRTVYSRTAFQLATSNDVRISLDTGLTFSTEVLPEGLRRGAFCLDESQVGRPGSSLEFPYAVLEIKLAADTTPQWVREVLATGIATPVHKFSKFLTATVLFHRYNGLSALPGWFVGEAGRETMLGPSEPRTAAAEALVAAGLATDVDSALQLADAELADAARRGLSRIIRQPPQALAGGDAGGKGGGGGGDSDDEGAGDTGEGGSGSSAARVRPIVPQGAPTALSLYPAPPVSLPPGVKGGLVSGKPTVGAGGNGSSGGNSVSIVVNPLASTRSMVVAAMSQPAGHGAVAPVQQQQQLEPVNTSRPGAKKKGGAVTAALASTARRASAVANAIFGASPTTDASAGAAAAAKLGKKANVEPKTFFANERTFLQWLQISVLLVGVSTGLLGYGSAESRNLGYILGIVGMVILSWGLWMFYSRIFKLQTRAKDGYDDRRGPCFLAIFIFVAMVANMALAGVSGTGTGGNGGVAAVAPSSSRLSRFHVAGGGSSSSSSSSGGGLRAPAPPAPYTRWLGAEELVAAGVPGPIHLGGLANVTVGANLMGAGGWALAASLGWTGVVVIEEGGTVQRHVPLPGLTVAGLGNVASSGLWVVGVNRPVNGLAVVNATRAVGSAAAAAASVLHVADLSGDLGTKTPVVGVSVAAGGSRVLVATSDAVVTYAFDVETFALVATARAEAAGDLVGEGEAAGSQIGALAVDAGVAYVLFPGRREVRGYSLPAWTAAGTWPTPAEGAWTGLVVGAGKIVLGEVGGEVWEVARG